MNLLISGRSSLLLASLSSILSKKSIVSDETKKIQNNKPFFGYNPIEFENDIDFPECIISYATKSNDGKGKEHMLAIAEVLRRNGFTSFNGSQVNEGENWKTKFFGKISKAKIGIIILSPEYFDSPNCQRECLEFVLNEKLKIIPLQFGLPNMKGDFLGNKVEQIEHANLIKQRIGNFFPPPDKGSYIDNWEINSKNLIRRINKHLTHLEQLEQEGLKKDKNNKNDITSEEIKLKNKISQERIVENIEDLFKEAFEAKDFKLCERIKPWLKYAERITQIIEMNKIALKIKYIPLLKVFKGMIDSFPQTLDEYEDFQINTMEQFETIVMDIGDDVEKEKLFNQYIMKHEQCIYHFGYIGLVLAAELGNDQNLKLLIDAGVLVDPHSCFQLLIDAGADESDLNQIIPGYDFENTPLIVAAGKGHAKCVKLLIQAAMNINDVGPLALLTAMQGRHDECVELLIKAGAHKAKGNISKLYGLEKVFSHHFLITAIEGGHDNYVELLINAGANVNRVHGNEQFSPLMYSVIKGNDKCAKLLIDAGANVDATLQNDSVTALMFAAQYGHHKCMKVLIDAGANIDIAPKSGWFYSALNPLSMAKQQGHSQCVKLLEEAQSKQGNKCK